MLWFYLRIYPGISHRMRQNQSMFCEWQNGKKLISVSSFEWSQYTIGRYLSHCINFLAVNSKVLWTISCPLLYNSIIVKLVKRERDVSQKSQNGGSNIICVHHCKISPCLFSVVVKVIEQPKIIPVFVLKETAVLVFNG